MEIGLSSLRDSMDALMTARHLDTVTLQARLMYLQRHCSMWPCWANANYFNFSEKVYAVNQSLPLNQESGFILPMFPLAGSMLIQRPCFSYGR